MIESEENSVFFSIASLWELQIKHDKHPDKMPYLSKDVMSDAIDEFEMLGIIPAHIFNLTFLKDIHNDPFDRILMVQAKTENMIFLTADSIIAQYGYKYILSFNSKSS